MKVETDETPTSTKAKDPAPTPTPYEPPADADVLGMLGNLRASVLELPMHKSDRSNLLFRVAYAQSLAESKQLCATKSQLDNFILHVFELTNAKRLSYETGSALIGEAGEIIRYLRAEDVCGTHQDWSWH